MIKELLNQPGAVRHFAKLDFSNNKELQDLVASKSKGKRYGAILQMLYSYLQWKTIWN